MAGFCLGIDVGGTAARWCLADAAGEPVARGTAPGATGHLFNSAEREKFVRMLAAIGDALTLPVAAVHMGVTGLGARVAPEVRALAAARFGIGADAVSASDDMELAYRAAFRPGEGHLVSAGTGSIGLHLRADGGIVRIGGRGMLIDDGGSGTWIALTALDRLFRRIDANGDPADAAVLAEHIYAAVGGPGWEDVRSFVYGADRGRIGGLAQAVAAAAEAGDKVAAGVLQDAVDELIRLASALIERVGQRPVAFVGGVVDLHPSIRLGLERAFDSVSFPRLDAALHAARMARARSQQRSAAGT